jgi:uncharacterized protein YjeT (DUF2065 family)
MALMKLTLTYLATYLAVGGAGLAFAPDLALDLLLSTSEYEDTMPRVVGMFMLVLGGFIAVMVRNGDYTYYAYSVVARTGIVAFLVGLLIASEDRLFAVLLAIVLAGLLPSYYALLRAPDGVAGVSR